MFPNLTIGPLNINMYDAMYGVGIIGMFVICLLSRKIYKTNLVRAIVYTAITFVFGVAGAKLMGIVYSKTLEAVSDGAYVPDSGVCIFGALMFLPVFMLLLALCSREKYRKLMDYMTPGIFLILGCAKFGCILSGCCFGIPYENGVYTKHMDTLVFPVQIYESICTFTVVAILIVLMLKRGKIRYGSLYPIGTILYCGCRMFWENYRYYEHAVEYDFLGKLTYWQHWALIAIIISVVWLAVLYSQEKYRDCDIEFGRIKIKDSVNSLEATIKEKKKEKHRKKAKKYQEKSKELKKKK